jgi:PEGA domain-containing protein
MARIAMLLLAGALAAGCGNKKNQDSDPKTPVDDPTLDVDEPRAKAPDQGLIITSSPSGAEVVIDGESKGNTPITVEKLGAGTHDVTFVFSDGEKVTQSIDLADNEYKKVHQSQSPDSSDAKMGDKK